jgi:cell division protein FtsQ
MRRFLRILLIIPVLYIIILPVYMASSSNAKPCSRIEINIYDSADYHFVTKRQLLNLAYGDNDRILGKPVKEVSVSDIENRINILRELKTAEVYMTIDGSLHVFVDQRNPVMRVMPDEGGDYFVDEDGIIMRRRNLYTPRLHIVEGNVHISNSMLEGVSVFDTSIKNSILPDMYHFVKYIEGDAFWSAMIDQISVDGRDEIDLIPRIGKSLIHLGTFENFREKLRNLSAFYEKVLPEAGWNKYSVINLEFRDQIVCKKRQQ